MSDNETAPIAWTCRRNVVLWNAALQRYDEYCEGVKLMQPYAVSELDETCVPLVPATEVDEARKVAEWLLAEKFHYRIESEDRWIATYDQLRDPNSAVALRNVANVLDHTKTHLATPVVPLINKLCKEADRIEGAAAADAAREARIKKLAWDIAGFSGNGGGPIDTATALEDLGYRLDPSQAKAAS